MVALSSTADRSNFATLPAQLVHAIMPTASPAFPLCCRQLTANGFGQGKNAHSFETTKAAKETPVFRNVSAGAHQRTFTKRCIQRSYLRGTLIQQQRNEGYDGTGEKVRTRCDQTEVAC